MIVTVAGLESGLIGVDPSVHSPSCATYVKRVGRRRLEIVVGRITERTVRRSAVKLLACDRPGHEALARSPAWLLSASVSLSRTLPVSGRVFVTVVAVGVRDWRIVHGRDAGEREARPLEP